MNQQYNIIVFRVSVCIVKGILGTYTETFLQTTTLKESSAHILHGYNSIMTKHFFRAPKNRRVLEQALIIMMITVIQSYIIMMVCIEAVLDLLKGDVINRHEFKSILVFVSRPIFQNEIRFTSLNILLVYCL